MTEGLKNEKVRWAEYLIELDEQKKSIVGNVFISTCYIVYLGPYTGIYRNNFIVTIMEKLKELQIQFLDDFDLKNVVGNNL